MPKSRLAVAFFATLALLFVSCGAHEVPLAPKTQTWAELRVVRRAVFVTPPDEPERAPYPRERLVDGERVRLDAGGLAWLRRDGGATLLVHGPAELTVRADSIDLDSGKIFVDSPVGVSTELETPAGPMHWANVRASMELGAAGGTRVYVLSGEVRTAGEVRAHAGEWLDVGAAGANAKISPALVWEDWTGGLATTDRVAASPPYGIGTVGGRSPAAVGQPRFPLAIQRLDVRVTIDGDFAHTEVDQTFFNPRSERVEGIYRFRTPGGALLERFGVDRAGELVWGRVKESGQAAAQYQSHVYEGSREDPALLSWEGPGAYQARLYPIEPGDTRRVVVRYSEWLGRSGVRGERRAYVYPMAAEGSEESLPHIEELAITVDLSRARADDVRVGMAGVHEGSRILVRGRDLVPRADFTIELFDKGLTAARGYRAKHTPDLEALEPSERAGAKELARKESDYLLVPVRAPSATLDDVGLDLVVVVDASAASDPGALDLARAATGALLAHLGATDRAVVLAGAEALRPVVADLTKPAAVGDDAKNRILAGLATLERGGATDLGAMLTSAAGLLDPARQSAIIYVGDGRPTVGELSLEELSQRLSKLPRPARVFALGVGPDPDMQILEGLARGAFAERIGDAYGAARAVLRLFENAERPAWLGASIDLGTDIERVYPRDTSAFVADETVVVVGRVNSGKLPKSIRVGGSQGMQEIALRPSVLDDHGDLRRRWASERLTELLDDAAGRAAMVDLGSRYGIITPVTSLYVPTTDEALGERATRRANQQRQKAKDSEDGDEVEEEQSDEASDNKEGGTGTRAKGDEGSMGKAESPARGAYGVRGPADNTAALKEAAEFGMIGLLNTGAGGTAPPAAPSPAQAKPPAAEEDANARSPAAAAMPSAAGNAWGADIVDAAKAPSAEPAKPADQLGSAGLGLSGVGAGGGGKGDGIGLADIGVLGHGAGTGTGQGFGSGHGRLGGSHRSGAPRVRMGAVAVSGRLPPEVIQRIVRQNYGRFRLCYERGLQNNPNLEGRVSTRFVIGTDGSVTSVENAGSDLPDSGVRTCVQQAFNGLTFPQPEGGVVAVTYPVQFAPGGGGADAAEPSAPVSLAVDGVPRFVIRCSAGADVPLADRVVLWRERMSRVSGSPSAVLDVYRAALASCEAPTWRERSRLLGLMVDALPQVAQRVQLWRLAFTDLGVADALYRSIVARLRTADELREFHAALGLRAIDLAVLEKALAKARTVAERTSLLAALVREWPDDFALGLRLLDALEDAEDYGGARTLARALRARPDVDARTRTAVGELYLRLAEKSERKEADRAEARRAFGEIVEFAPDDPIARRRLGDLLRAHGWYSDARRQYETLAKLSPDDSNVGLLLAAADEGEGKLEAAVRWIETGGSAGAPDVDQSPASASRAIAATFLAWGRADAREKKDQKTVDALLARATRVLRGDRDSGLAGSRATLTWSHPDFHPTLWTNTLGSPMPAPEGDVTLGVAQARIRDGVRVEVRIEPEELEAAARLGAEARLTVVVDELGAKERIVRERIRFERAGPKTIAFVLRGGEVTRE